MMNRREFFKKLVPGINSGEERLPDRRHPQESGEKGLFFSRRDFIKIVALTGAFLALPSEVRSQEFQETLKEYKQVVEEYNTFVYEQYKADQVDIAEQIKRLKNNILPFLEKFKIKLPDRQQDEFLSEQEVIFRKCSQLGNIIGENSQYFSILSQLKDYGITYIAGIKERDEMRRPDEDTSALVYAILSTPYDKQDELKKYIEREYREIILKEPAKSVYGATIIETNNQPPIAVINHYEDRPDISMEHSRYNEMGNVMMLGYNDYLEERYWSEKADRNAKIFFDEERRGYSQRHVEELVSNITSVKMMFDRVKKDDKLKEAFYEQIIIHLRTGLRVTKDNFLEGYQLIRDYEALGLLRLIGMDKPEEYSKSFVEEVAKRLRQIPLQRLERLYFGEMKKTPDGYKLSGGLTGRLHSLINRRAEWLNKQEQRRKKSRRTIKVR